MLPPGLVQSFPKLDERHAEKTSDPDIHYNCIAWAAERDKKRWWQPVKIEPWDHWPNDVPDDGSIESFVVLFEKMGYQTCGSSNLEMRFEKVAIYSDFFGFTHVSAQLCSGAWTSKLGKYEDIQHDSLAVLEGNNSEEYGKAKLFLRRRCGVSDTIMRCCFKVFNLLRFRFM